MVDRVIIDSTAASPFRVSVAGVDAALAEFNNLIFDGNQAPLRLSATGYASVIGITYNDYLGGKNTEEGSPVLVTASPSGKTPIWLAMITKNSGFLQQCWHNNAVNDGGGSSICQSGGNNYFIPVNNTIGAPGTPTTPGLTMYVNYAIMKNWT